MALGSRARQPIYGADVEIIGHEYTRQRLAAGDSTRGRSWDLFIGGLPARIDELRTRVAATADAERGKLQAQLAVLETQLEGTGRSPSCRRP